MRSATAIQLDKAWWKKERPIALKKSGPQFEKGLETYEDAAGKNGDARALDSALTLLEKIAKDVVTEAKTLEKATKDKKEKDDLHNTIVVMDRPFASAIAAERKRAATLVKAAAKDDDEGGITDPAQYPAYFRKFTPVLVNGQMNFAVGVPPGKPEAVRLMFHRSQGGKMLATHLKKELGHCKTTFGTAGAANMAEAAGDEATRTTLVLDLEGRPIPALGKRVRIMLRKLKITEFNKVKILVAGQEAETSDETEGDDVTLPDLGPDTDDDDQAQLTTAPANASPVSAPPPDTKALFAGLDPESQRQINAATDEIFYQQKHLPLGQKIPSGADPNAAIWLAIRDGVMTHLVSDPGNPARQLPPALANMQKPQWETHRNEEEDYFRTGLKLSQQDIEKVIRFSHDNAMVQENGEQKGAQRLIDALSGKSALGALGDDMKAALCYDFALQWLYSPDFHEDGAEVNLDLITKYAKTVPGLAQKMAQVFRETWNTVPNDEFIGANYDVLEKERSIQTSLLGHAIDLDPMDTVTFAAHGQRLAEIMMGLHVDWMPGTEWSGNPDRYGQDLPSLSEDRRNAVVNAVAHGALDPAETDKFFNRVFGAKSNWDVSPVDSIFGKAFDVDNSTDGEQESMAKLLTHVTNGAHARTPEDEAFNASNMMDIMKSKGGREVLFTTSMSNEYRLWALDMMSKDSNFPDKKPWTAADLADGWESPAVAQAFAGKAMDQARQTFPEPWKVNGKADRGMLGNVVGEMFHLKQADPPKNQTDEEKKKRLDQGFNNPVYDLDVKPMKEILDSIGDGDAMVTMIPVSWMNREEGPAEFQVLRVQKDANSPPIFIDEKGSKYDSAAVWVKDNVLPPGKMTFPGELDLAHPLVTVDTPKGKGGARAVAIVDKAVMVAGAVAGVALIIGTGGAATPLVATAAAAYSGTRAVQHLVEMHDRGHDITDLGDSQVRGLYFDVATNAFAVGGLGSAKLLGVGEEGVQISRAGANLIAGLQFAGNITNAASLANQINDLAEAWDSLPEDERDKRLISLGFTIAMHGAAIAKGGGFREQFDVTRIRNQIENGTPFNLEQAKPGELSNGEKIAVRNENGKMTIIYDGPRPTKDMLHLHGDAAVSMEASYTLRKKLTRMMGGADPEQAHPGTAAWEAVEEIKKIKAEAEGILSRIGSADAKTQQELVARQVELNEAIVRENAKLDHYDQAGKGYVAAPAAGSDQAKALGWGKVKKPDGYEWVAGDKEPHLFAPGKEKMYYDPHQKTFIPEAEKAKIEEAARALEKSGDKFMKSFDMSRGPSEVGSEEGPDGNLQAVITPDETITAVKGKMPQVNRNQNMEETVQELADQFGKKPEQVGKLVEMMGESVGKRFGKAWKKALKESQPAQDAMDKITVRTKLAEAADRAQQPERAAALRKQASKLAKDAYDPVRGKFWELIYNSDKENVEGLSQSELKDLNELKDLKGQILAAGLTFEEGKAPYLEVPDPDNPGKTVKMQVTLEHTDRKTDVPMRAQDADNLEFSFRYENTVVLEHIRRIVRNQMGTNSGEPHPMN